MLTFDPMDRIMLNGANIRKITVGDVKTGIKYTVGSKVGPNRDIEIIRIIYDENSFFLSGHSKYLVYAQKEGEDEQKLYKWFEDQPVAVELDIDN